MRLPTDAVSDLDEEVGRAFAAWDTSHRTLTPMRSAYDLAMQQHQRRDGPDPVELRVRMKSVQVQCDQLFFQFLRVAEVRTRERYI